MAVRLKAIFLLDAISSTFIKLKLDSSLNTLDKGHEIKVSFLPGCVWEAEGDKRGVDPPEGEGQAEEGQAAGRIWTPEVLVRFQRSYVMGKLIFTTKN